MLVVALSFWGCATQVDSGSDLDRNELPAKIKTVLETSESFVLLSLDPSATPDTKETFREYTVLGKVDIRDQGERIEILQALSKVSLRPAEAFWVVSVHVTE